MVQAGLIPNVRSYDPTFSYEVVTLVQHGMQRMLAEQHDEYWYITLMNENYSHPAMPEGSAEGIIKGMYLFKDAGKPKKGEHRVQLMGSGTILREVIAAAELLDKDLDRKRVVQGKRVSVRVDLGGRRIIKQKTPVRNRVEMNTNNQREP